MKKFILLAIMANLAFANALKFYSIKSDFVQTIARSEGKSLSYSGTFYYKIGPKVLWHYDKPIEKELYILGKKVVIIEPELEQATLTTLKKAIDFDSILRSAKQKSADVFIAKLDEIEYTIFTKNNKIARITFSDDFENRVEIKLINPIYDIKLHDIFNYTINPDFDIITQ